jgi:hypothetical protein
LQSALLLEYSPSADLKSGMPLAVDTPAPPKKTILRETAIISLNLSIAAYI